MVVYSAGRHTVCVSTRLPVDSWGCVTQTSLLAVSAGVVAQAARRTKTASKRLLLYTDILPARPASTACQYLPEDNCGARDRHPPSLGGTLVRTLVGQLIRALSDQVIAAQPWQAFEHPFTLGSLRLPLRTMMSRRSGQGFKNPAAEASTTACTRVPTRSLRHACEMCSLTVSAEIPRISAMLVELLPTRTHCKHSL